MTKKITIPPPDAATLLVARHLDETEGPLQPGTVIRPVDRDAITLVLCYIAKAHNAPAATPTDRGVERERIVKALADALKPRYGGPQHNTPGGLPLTATAEEICLHRAQPLADAVMAALRNAPAAPEICELPHETIEEEDECYRQRTAQPLPAYRSPTEGPVMQDDDIAFWKTYLSSVADWRSLTAGVTPKETGCGAVYELPAPLGRESESFAIADMQGITWARPHYHANGEVETYFVIAGSGHVVVGDRLVAVSPGSVVSTPSGVVHYAISAEPCALVLAVVNNPPFDAANVVEVAEDVSSTPCGPAPDSCEPGGEPCARHEREQSHADGEHELCGSECDATDPALLKQTLTRAVFALKTPSPDGSSHYQAGWDDALEAAIDAVAQVFDTLNQEGES